MTTNLKSVTVVPTAVPIGGDGTVDEEALQDALCKEINTQIRSGLAGQVAGAPDVALYTPSTSPLNKDIFKRAIQRVRSVVEGQLISKVPAYCPYCKAKIA